MGKDEALVVSEHNTTNRTGGDVGRLRVAEDSRVSSRHLARSSPLFCFRSKKLLLASCPHCSRKMMMTKMRIGDQVAV